MRLKIIKPETKMMMARPARRRLELWGNETMERISAIGVPRAGMMISLSGGILPGRYRLHIGANNKYGKIRITQRSDWGTRRSQGVRFGTGGGDW